MALPAVVAMTVASATSLTAAGDCDDPAAGGYGTNRGRSGLADAWGDSCDGWGACDCGLRVRDGWGACGRVLRR